MNISSVYSNTVPLCFLPDGRLACYQRGSMVLFQDGKNTDRVPVSISGKERLLGWSKLVTRLFRFGFRAAAAVDNGRIILSRGSVLHELDLMNGELSNGWNCGEGIRPLVLSDVQGIEGFKEGIYFGGYLKNYEKKPVNIYHRKGVDDWEVTYSFPEGAINHVHNVISDPYRQCVWVFTGDFDDAAAIWRATDDFKNVERVAGGDQKWRGCVGFAIPEGLLYATDTPFSDNHIFLLRPDGLLEVIGDICGSCIYGCQWKDKYIFSSTVEADGRDETLAKLLFSKKRGRGIKEDFVILYVGDYAHGFEEVYKEEKDWLPFIFQFGAFKFPAGVNNSDMLYFQPVATRKNDLKLIEMEF